MGNLGNIKIRYLNYISEAPSEQTIISLGYPDFLVTATLYSVVIKNLNECTRL